LQTDYAFSSRDAVPERIEREDTFIHAFGFSNRKDKAKQRRERKGWKS
jgi:hypothetical protein